MYKYIFSVKKQIPEGKKSADAKFINGTLLII